MWKNMSEVHVHKTSEMSLEMSGKARRKERKLKHEPQSVTMDDVPEPLNVMDVFEGHAKEFTSMAEALKKKGGSKRTFQKLSRHMRRRAASHNVKRLPRRLRGLGALEMDEKKESNRKESRRTRRRPKNLRAEYQRRQKNKQWLETHIWHAKRMKIMDRWGYRLAQNCNDKGKRANYRYCKQGAILSDISYFSCIQLQGTEFNLHKLLTPLFHKDTGPIPMDLTDGLKEGMAIMYKPHLYPYHCIGPVSFLWEPAAMAVGELRKVWLWVHPSIYEEVIGVLETEIMLLSCSDNEPGPHSDTKHQSRNEPNPHSQNEPHSQDEHNFQSKNESHFQSENEPHFKSENEPHSQDEPHSQSENEPYFQSENEPHSQSENKPHSQDESQSEIVPIIQITSLRDELVRFRLVGPQSLNVLLSVLHAKTPPIIKEENSQTTPTGGIGYLKTTQSWPEIAKTSSQRRWWIGRDTGNSKDTKAKLEALSAKPHAYCPGSVCGLVVEDPRLMMPSTRSTIAVTTKEEKDKQDDWLQEMSDMLIQVKSEIDVETKTEPPPCESIHQQHQSVTNNIDSIQLSVSDNNPSLLWSSSIRHDVSTSIIPHHVINEVKSNLFIKPNTLDLGNESSAIPVILVNKSYSSCSDKRPVTKEVSGWDIILPCNWGMAFWVPLVYQGARTCGLSEMSTCTALECLQPDFPLDFPDSFAGEIAAKESREELTAKHIRYPPDKRPNFGKLNMPNPFGCDWNELISQNMKGETGEKRVLEGVVNQSRGKVSRLSEPPYSDIKVVDGCHGEGYYVLRCLEDLDELTRFIDTLFSKCWRQNRTVDKYRQLYERYEVGSVLTRHSRALVTVKLEAWSRGTLNAHSMIAIPNGDDLGELRQEKCFLGPMEPLSPNGLTIVEDKSISIGQTQLSSQRVKSVMKERKKLLKRGNQDVTSVTEQYQLGPVLPSRHSIGRVGQTMDYRYTSSLYAGVGHCTLQGLVRLCETCYVSNCYQLLCLVRGHGSRQYVFALLKLHSL